MENHAQLTSKNQQIDGLQTRIDTLVLKIVCIGLIRFHQEYFICNIFRMEIKKKCSIYKKRIKCYKFELMK